MAWAHVFSDANFSNGVTSRVFTRAPGAIGNLIIVAIDVGEASGATVPSISDTAGNTWNVCNPRLVLATNGATLQSWFAIANGTSSTTITILSNVPAAYMTASYNEFSGNHATPLDQHVDSADAASGTPTSPSITPSVDDCLFWAWCTDSLTTPYVGLMDGVTATLGAIDTDGEGSEYRFLTGRSGVAMTAAFNGSGVYHVMAATFKPSATAPPLNATVGEPLVQRSVF